MGRLQATEMSSMLPEQQALEWHLTANHYPPIHESFVPVAIQAINRAVAAIEEEDRSIWREQIEMPNGKVLTVSEICEGLHLDTFVEARLGRSEDE